MRVSCPQCSRATGREATARAGGRSATAGRKSQPPRLRDADASQFGGADPGAVEFLVILGVRPAQRASELLLASQAWAESQNWRAWAHTSPSAEAPRKATFAASRDAVRELTVCGVKRKALPGCFALFPGILALPKAELEARLDALVDAGVDELRLGRLLERDLRVLAPSPVAAAERAAALALLGVPDVGALLQASPGLVWASEQALTARVEELGALGLTPPSLGSAAGRHPPLLLPFPLSTRTHAFWRAQLGEGELTSLALAVPAVLTTSPTVLRRKAAFAADNLGLSLPLLVQRCPSFFDNVNLERSLAPRLSFLRLLGVRDDEAASQLRDWVEGDVGAFIHACARMAPEVAEERRSEETFRAHAARNVSSAAAHEGGDA